jgi:hypothetical protein
VRHRHFGNCCRETEGCATAASVSNNQQGVGLLCKIVGRVPGAPPISWPQPDAHTTLVGYQNGRFSERRRVTEVTSAGDTGNSVALDQLVSLRPIGSGPRRLQIQPGDPARALKVACVAPLSLRGKTDRKAIPNQRNPRRFAADNIAQTIHGLSALKGALSWRVRVRLSSHRSVGEPTSCLKKEDRLVVDFEIETRELKRLRSSVFRKVSIVK